ncbi:branched-chain amino acid transport system II carrier protein [Flavobacteriaceae bacterium S0825]|uniref:branched-chain amino acid transport system II carrier protein n=1 Tax=Gaetbulibacter sp. S0825 TaxID=2720084 RepID=UPI00142FFEB6|nr:branched-chain amino acid transport system II carrier protein [Gaetbulibacter sp. S0825]MCK0108035.1 branched-chain amino acid transport system II carrier protein [Flavobacteriaceae bacterium S0825]NIX63671.1 branched-chain amino acid transport system II carrier protein [Gaetbulibacter sp. S0825]
MNNKKTILIIGFALFASFFGAGNLILPPFLGFNSGPDWWLVTLGFVTSATVIPLLALFGHARLQGTMLDFGNKVSPLFSLVYCLCVYTIAITLPIPRTAAVTHEMAIQPFFNTPSLLTSSLYFGIAFIFIMKRDSILSILGKFLTPLIVLILLAIIIIGLFTSPESMNTSTLEAPALVAGLLEGYQTYDALGGILIGGVVIISLNLEGGISFEDKKTIIGKSGLVAATGLFIIYAGMIAVGALHNTEFEASITRPELLSGLSLKTLGNIGNLFLSVLISLACFTTAVSVIVGTADFFKGLFKESQLAYTITAIISCIIGVLVGQFDVHYIIVVALPALMFIYPLTIVLILLNVIPKKYATKLVFKTVVLVTFIFSIPDFLGFLIEADWLQNVKEIIPFAKENLGWALPALVTFIVINLIQSLKQRDA